MLDTQTLQHKPYQLPVSEEMLNLFSEQQYTCHVTEDDLFLIGKGGIFVIEDTGIPVQVLNWNSLGYIYYSSIIDDLWIVDRDTFFLRASKDSNDFQEGHYYYIQTGDAQADLRDTIHVEYLLPDGDWMETAVTAFNRENTEYRVELEYIDYGSDYAQNLILQEEQPDIVVTPNTNIIKSLYDKHAFVDLTPYFGEILVGTAREVFQTGEALYTLPMSFSLRTFTAPSAVVSDTLTWDTLYAITDSLHAGDALIGDTADIQNIRNQTIMEFVDFENKTCHFDTEQFRTIIRYLENMDQYADTSAGVFTEYFLLTSVDSMSPYCTMPQTRSRLENGTLKFLSTNLQAIHAFHSLKLMYGNSSYSLCGYPTLTGVNTGGSIYANYLTHVLASTDVQEGCIAFLEFLLSDSMQTHNKLVLNGLPVTKGALEQALVSHRCAAFRLSDIQESGQYLAQAGVDLEIYPVHKFADELHVLSEDPLMEDLLLVELTDTDISAILTFVDNCHASAGADDFIRTIVDEELSFWRSNTRTLEETTKIIQSRVWIYLNE